MHPWAIRPRLMCRLASYGFAHAGGGWRGRETPDLGDYWNKRAIYAPHTSESYTIAVILSPIYYYYYDYCRKIVFLGEKYSPLNRRNCTRDANERLIKHASRDPIYLTRRPRRLSPESRVHRCIGTKSAQQGSTGLSGNYIQNRASRSFFPTSQSRISSPWKLIRLW